MAIADDKKINLQERVYSAMKEAIIDGRLAPGEKLKEAKLAAWLNASRTPIREALRKLEQEGLVAIVPDQGAHVTPIRASSLPQLYECRAVLEGLAARKAAIHMDQRGWFLLEDCLLLTEQYLSRGDVQKVVDKNTLFHDTIMEASQNPMLHQMMDVIRTQVLRYRAFSTAAGARSSFLQEHTEIYQAIRRKDPETAEQLMRQHIMRDLGTILQQIESGEERGGKA